MAQQELNNIKKDNIDIIKAYFEYRNTQTGKINHPGGIYKIRVSSTGNNKSIQ